VTDEVVVGEVLDEGSTGALPEDLPDEPAAALEVVGQALAAAQQEASGYLDDLRRVAADFDNFRKRVARERDAMVARSNEALIAAILPVLDSLDAGLAATTNAGPESSIAEGLRSTRQQLLEVLAGEGLSPIETDGADFDPALHEAASGGGTGHLVVTAEIRRGYLLRDRVLRPSLVAVAAEPASDEGEGES
jgi:molecular chaperone GrpE